MGEWTLERGDDDGDAAALATIFGLTEEGQRQPLSFAASIARYGIVLRNPLSIKVYGVVAIEGALSFGVFPLVAPLMDTSSSRGLEMARWAASTVRCCPLPRPTPMSARPLSFMMVRTSAKSMLMMPW